jgi:hypothetical protein
MGVFGRILAKKQKITGILREIKKFSMSREPKSYYLYPNIQFLPWIEKKIIKNRLIWSHTKKEQYTRQLKRDDSLRHKKLSNKGVVNLACKQTLIELSKIKEI